MAPVDNYEQRFGGIGRLYTPDGLARLRQAHICVIGIGGVGSWVVEALSRSGIGELTLIDMDDICVTNINLNVPSILLMILSRQKINRITSIEAMTTSLMLLTM